MQLPRGLAVASLSVSAVPGGHPVPQRRPGWPYMVVSTERARCQLGRGSGGYREPSGRGAIASPDSAECYRAAAAAALD